MTVVVIVCFATGCADPSIVFPTVTDLDDNSIYSHAKVLHYNQDLWHIPCWSSDCFGRALAVLYSVRRCALCLIVAFAAVNPLPRDGATRKSLEAQHWINYGSAEQPRECPHVGLLFVALAFPSLRFQRRWDSEVWVRNKRCWDAIEFSQDVKNGTSILGMQCKLQCKLQCKRLWQSGAREARCSHCWREDSNRVAAA